MTCEDCGCIFHTGEQIRFVNDDENPTSGFVLCDDCWQAGLRAEARRIAESERPE